MLPPLDPNAVPYLIDLRVSLAEFERTIAPETDEIAAAFDASGRLILRPRRGVADEVGFFQGEFAWLVDSIVAHNHPLSGALSASDAFFAAERDVAALRAVLPTGVIHTLTRPEKGWPDGEAMANAIDRALVAIRAENASRVARGKPTMGNKEGQDAIFALRRNALARLGVEIARTDVWR